MTRRQAMALPLFASAAPGAAAESSLDIGSRRELFLDGFLIDRLSGGATQRLGVPVDAGPVLALDRAWEGRFSAYATVIRESARKFHLYYRGVPTAGQDGRSDEVTCYAASEDGVRFTRPALDSGGRNVILAGSPPLQHNFCPFLDTRPAGVTPDCPAA